MVAVIAAYLGFCAWAYVAAFLGWGQALTWVYAHETLTAGLLALASALIGAWFLSRQTTQAERHERQRLLRRREATRTVLPLALSSITRYSPDAARATKSLIDQVDGEDLPERSKLKLPDNPTVPSDAIQTLRELAEAVSLEEVRPVAILVADIQVQASRLASSIAQVGDLDKSVAKSNLESYIIDCAMIHARASGMFAFGRGLSASVPEHIMWSDVHSALYYFDMFESDYDRIRETILSRAGGDLNTPVQTRWTAPR